MALLGTRMDRHCNDVLKRVLIKLILAVLRLIGTDGVGSILKLPTPAIAGVVPESHSS